MKLATTRLLSMAALSLLFVSVNVSVNVSADANDNDAHNGARIFLERCALCHGSKGLGEGPMALLVRGYPDTNLKTTEESAKPVRHIVEFGNTSSSAKTLSPPWRNELAVTEIAAVTSFVELLQNDFGQAQRALTSVDIAPENIDGRKIYRARCESCHGATGKGDGRLSRLIRNPAPTNLTRSLLSHQETVAIISAGGRAMGRSDSMPPWGQELVHAELVSVATYLASLRMIETE